MVCKFLLYLANFCNGDIANIHSSLEFRHDTIFVEIVLFSLLNEVVIGKESIDAIPVSYPLLNVPGQDDFVTNMHTKSGLLPEITGSTISLADAGAETLAFLREHIAEPRSVPLCGNSIGTDRRFLAKQLPEIEEFLHYRSIDVSTIKELARRWSPKLVFNKTSETIRQWYPGGGVEVEGAAHDALYDIKGSIAELAFYRKTLFN